MRVLVCGGRDYTDYKRLKFELDNLVPSIGSNTIISGCAKGADTLAIQYAEEYSDGLLKFPADWGKHGKAAGFIRNQQMLDEGKPDLVVAFPGGKGTQDMINRSRKAGIKVVTISE